MKFNIKKVIGIALIVIVLVAVAVMISPWLIMHLGGMSMPNPAIPKITHGEFPFKLEYEVYDERHVVEDAIICEYDGVGWNEGQGKFRKWKSYLASGNEKIILLTTNDGKELYYDPGPAWYYMRDSGGASYDHSFPNTMFTEKDGKFTVRGLIRENELKQYHI